MGQQDPVYHGLLRGAIASLRHSINDAVVPHLRAVTVECHGSHVHFTAYYDGDITEEDNDLISIVETELIANLVWDIFSVSRALVNIRPAAATPSIGVLIYSRESK